MIRKDSRPIGRIGREVHEFTPQSSPRFRMLRELVKFALGRGRVVLSQSYRKFSDLETMPGIKHRITCDVVYVGKRKCRDTQFRRILRKVNRGNVIQLPV